jgi:hypothetical protein
MTTAYDAVMRTTMTMDADVALQLKRKLKETKLSQKELLNRALRKGLSQVRVESTKQEFEVEPHSFGLKPEFDRDKMNQLYDQLLVEDYLRQQDRDLARR